MDDLLNQESHFAFGKNWIDYSTRIDEPKIRQAMDDLSRLNEGRSFEGKTFLDIGSGSGLHALAATRLGAQRVHCVDIDPDSVEASRRTFARFAPDAPVSIEIRSVFDLTPETIGQFDIVYSWGVLHHTGNMDRAITAAATLVAPGGTFLIALYRKTPYCGIWRSIKKYYARSSRSTQLRIMRFYLFIKHLYPKIRNVDLWIRGKPTLDIKKHIATYGERRGMDYYNDAHDWLGGYPYESIAADDCISRFSKMGFALGYSNIHRVHRLRGIFGSGCDEFGFHRVA